MPDYRITFFSTLRQEDDGLVHVRVEVEVPVHPSYLTDAACGQTLAKDVGLDVTAKLMEKFEQLAAGPEAPA
jgi:ribosomal protein L31